MKGTLVARNQDYASLLIRMLMNIHANRFARSCYEEAFKYACKRETFDKKLIEHPVIREKLAHMIKRIESTHALLER
jgi:alkylation response protein AidB-like acyl-CoA dehydrogenase